jgi:hydrophobe/amphiphile efflux-1 (HAE1) family protein
MFSRFFIDRPIFAAVISIFIVLAGLAAMQQLPISQYPEIAPPVVTVTAVYPGASAEVLNETVASPLEDQINGVENMIYMQSTSASNGTVTINVSFEVGSDADRATVGVNNRVKLAEPRLPQEVRRQGVSVRKSSSSFLQVVTLQSPSDRFNLLDISNYATINVADRLKRIPGVADVLVFGARDYAMRIWLDLPRLAQLKLSPAEIIAAVQEQNAQFATGKVGAEPQRRGQELTYTITTQGRFKQAREFEQIILRANPDGSLLRLKDVARVELAAKEYDFVGKVNGKPVQPIGIFLMSGANALATAAAVKDTMAELSQKFPAGLEYGIPYDTTLFVEISIREVVKTLAEAMALVLLVVYVFLQNWRAALIPFLAVPVSLIGAFAGLWLLGYSINTLTLFGMVLAIGIVVDDAIVVLENVERHMAEEDTTPRQAAYAAMGEVTSPIIAIALVLASVFIPVAFIGGLAGELYRQFAITIAIAVSISGVVALTLTPALCALILRPEHKREHGLFRRFNNWFASVTRHYSAGVRFMIRHAPLGLALFAGMIVLTVWLAKVVPGSFVPPEDQGYYVTALIMPDGASLQRTEAVMDRVEQLALSNPNAKDTVALSGFDLISNGIRTSAGTMFVPLKDWDKRPTHVEQIIGDLFMKTAGIKEAIVFAFNPPAIMGMGETGGFEFYIQNKGEGGARRLAEVTQQFIAAASQEKSLGPLQTLFRANVPQLYVDLDRARAKSLGVNITEVYDALSATLGSYYVNDFNLFGRTWTVWMSAEPRFRAQPEDIGGVYVKGGGGEMVPLSALARVSYTNGPEIVERFNNAPAAKVLGSAAPGYSSGQAITLMEQLAEKHLPADFGYDWGGASYQEKRTGGASNQALGMGIVMVFLILAAQYSRWSLPLSVLLAMPFGLFGALAAVWLRGLPNDVYFQIGLVTLVGLAAKNAILIVEFALHKKESGMPTLEAAAEAARIRFRPILMTSLAFIFGVLPLAISTGAGAAARHAIGTGVMGGMLAATFLAIFFVPLFFKLVVDRRLRVVDAQTAGQGDGS